MSLRKIEPSDIVGKTVVSVNTECTNVLKLKFSDGKSLELWAEDAVFTPYGNIPGIFVEDEPNTTE